MAREFDIDDVILNYDPEQPPKRFLGVGLEAVTASLDSRLPRPVLWPKSPPTAVPLSPPPAETDSLARFAGYEAVVMTWTGICRVTSSSFRRLRIRQPSISGRLMSSVMASGLRSRAM